MKNIVVGISMALLVSCGGQLPFTWAQTPEPVIVFENLVQCTNFTWDAVTSEPLMEYRMYVKKDDVDLPYVAIPPADVTVVCADASVIPEAKFEVYVTAVDLLLNESDPSNVLRFLYVIPPAAPGNFCMVGQARDGSALNRT